MKRYTPTQEEMQNRIARFKDLVSTKARIQEKLGLPQEVMEMITAKATFNVMSPGPLPGQISPKPAVEGGDAGVFRLGIVTCPPGQGPGLHVHYHTQETFMCLTGRWLIQWGDHGEESTVLEHLDLIAVPSGVTRRFENASDQDAHLLVIVQGERDRFDDIDRDPATAEKIASRFGPETVSRLEAAGWKFTIGKETADEHAGS
ncbi:Cupin domain protein [Pigmentiphaga humi]|uniref:Cupin domain protein n=1 Tax=Pigmentiphaga humi TaxID=2478468 RepID=A0A3P4AXR3_9BURK|nr:cupin domain-containing protein [Pigmentiphaga humi]VCU68208.1 Cupin domain protein [Pigmentiphaga humi]